MTRTCDAAVPPRPFACRLLRYCALGGLAAVALSACAVLDPMAEFANDDRLVVDLTPYHQRVITRCFLNTQMACKETPGPELLMVSTAGPDCSDPLMTVGYCMTHSGLPPRAISLREGLRDDRVENALVVRVRRKGRVWLKVITRSSINDCDALTDDLKLKGGCRPR